MQWEGRREFASSYPKAEGHEVGPRSLKDVRD